MLFWVALHRVGRMNWCDPHGEKSQPPHGEKSQPLPKLRAHSLFPGWPETNSKQEGISKWRKTKYVDRLGGKDH